MRNPVDRPTAGLPKGYRVTIDWLATIVGAILIVLAVKQWVINPYRIPSSAMEPTLHCARPAQGCKAQFSDRALACRICYDIWSPKRGDIVVFNTPPQAKICSGGVFVKRLIGLPGDTIREDSKGYIWINGRQLDEPYIKPDRRASDQHRNQRWHVPASEYFMMGDNRGGSCDSRVWGPSRATT